MKVATKLSISLLLVPVIMLTGCKPWELFKGKKETSSAVLEGQVLATAHGKPLMTVEKFEDDFNKFLEENPQYKAAMQFVPNLKKDVFMGMVNQELVDLWAKKSGVDQKAEYARDMERMLANAKRIVNSKYFSEAYPVAVSQSELKEFYEIKKTVMPELIISRGGVTTKALSFDKQDAAAAFLSKVKELKDFDAAAKTMNLEKKIRDFKQIHEQSMGVDSAMRDVVLALKKFPAHEKVASADGKKFWVFAAIAKEDSQYQPFEKVKAGLEQLVTHEKRAKVIGEALEQLKKEYELVVQEDYFQEKVEAPAQEPTVVEEGLAETIVEDAKVAAKSPAKQAKAAPVAKAA